MMLAIVTVLILLGCGLFAYAFRTHVRLRRLLEKMERITDLNHDIASSVDQVVSVNSEITTASLEQLDSLHTTVTASHEIRSMVDRTTDNAGHLKTEAQELKGLVDSGMQTIQQMVQSSQEIKSGMITSNSGMKTSIEELTNALQVIQEIATKTKVINEIVFQTKLLSFNASVEAARAGEAGKGFSVVAEEIGKLAQMSGQAADEIEQIVASSVNVASTAIRSAKEKIEVLTEDTTKRSDVGFQNAKKVEQTFGNMQKKISETVMMIEQISAAASDQAIGISALNESIVKFQEATDRNRLVVSQGTEHAHGFKDQIKGLAETLADCAHLMGWNHLLGHKTFRKFVWSAKLEVHVPKMDDEHKILVSKINDLIDALDRHDRSADLPLVQKAFGALAEYTTKHFADEEAYMKSVNYPQLHSHQRIHKKLLEQVGEFGGELTRGQLDDMKLIAFLRNWLISHIMGVDMQYGEHANSRQHRRVA